MKSISLKPSIRFFCILFFVLITASSLAYAKTTQDLPNDTFGTNTVKIDILSVDIEFDSKYLFITCNFASKIFDSNTGDPFALFGYIDLDIDQNSKTGATALSDYYNGSSEIGMDYYLEFMPDATPGFVALKDSNAKFIGNVGVVFNETFFIVTIPLKLIDNDDGYIDYTAFFGDAGGPDDVIPNRGFATNKAVPNPNPDPAAPDPSGDSEGGGCFINTVNYNSNNVPVLIIILLSGLFISCCIIIIKKTF
jgi:hypothetical protein